METETNRLLLKSLQKDSVQIKSTVHCLSKELKALIHNRNIFHYYVPVEKPLSDTPPWNTLSQNRHFVNPKASFSHKIPKAHSHSLLIKLETQLVSHPRLALPQWNSENICYKYQFMKLQSFMMLKTLYIVLHIPTGDKSLQFHLCSIHNIPFVHPILKNHLGTQFRKCYVWP